MSISNNYIPEKINDFNTYLDGNKMIGVLHWRQHD